MGARLLATLCAAWLSWAQPALAQGNAPSDLDAKARHLYRNGEVLYSEGLYGDAIAAWQAAYQLSSRPLLLYNMANAQERIGRWQDALDSLNRYRAFAPSEERATLGKRIANIERHLAQQREEAAQQTPPEPQPRPEPQVQNRPQPQPQPRPQPRRPDPRTIQTAQESGWRMGAAPISLYALSGAGIVTGTIFAFRAQAAREAAREVCTGDATVFCPSSAAKVIRQDRVSSNIADAGFGVALTGTVVATVLAVSSKNRVNRTTMSLAPAARGAGLRLSSRF